MKKLIIAAAIVCAAAISQAAAINWNSSTKITDGENVITSFAGTEWEGGSIVLALLGTAEDYSDATVLSTGTITSSGMAANLGKVSGTYSFTYGAAGTIQNGDIIGVLFQDAEGNLSQLQYIADGSAVSDTFTVSGLDDNGWGKDFAWGAAGNFQAAPVPEPTSAMLLMLGLAGLALKRKQA